MHVYALFRIHSVKPQKELIAAIKIAHFQVNSNAIELHTHDLALHDGH